MRIAVDVSMLSGTRNGISRYLEELLSACILAPEAGCQWLLYGRKAVRGEVLSRANVRFRGDGLPHHSGRVASLFSTQPYWAAIDRPDVFWGPAHRLPWRLPSTTARVVTIHDLCWLEVADTMRRSTRRLDTWLMPRALAMADRIIAVSKSIGETIRVTFPDTADRVVVIPAGTSVLPRAKGMEAVRHLGVQSPYVLFVGTIEPRKNLRRLIEAFSRLSGAGCEHARLVIVGAYGWGGQGILEGIADLGLSDRVVVLGRVSDDDLATLYAHARCLALPSLYEGFGLPLLEAMASGTPVLTSRMGSMAEIVADGGVLVDPLAVESIEAGLRKLLCDDDLRRELGNRARERAAAYSWARAARETLAAMGEAMALRRGSMPTRVAR